MPGFEGASVGRTGSAATARGRRPARERAGAVGLALLSMALAPIGVADAAAAGGAAGSVAIGAQDPGEAVMVAAGRWVLERLPSGPAGIDPHRSGAGKDGARLQRVAVALGSELTPLDRAKACTDAIDPSTCQLSTARLLAIGAPRMQGDRAEVKVYAWYRTGSADAPVAEKSWNLTLQRMADGWRVVSEG